MKHNWITKTVMIVSFMLLAALAFGGVVMLLWNALMPHIFGLPLISYFQALGLLVLAKIFFGGFGGGRHRWRKRGGHRGPGYWKNKWVQMDPEERNAFKEKMRARCSSRGSSTNSSAPVSTPEVE